MKLYTYPSAPSPRRVELLLRYKGAEIEREEVDIGAGEQLGESFRQINPRCTVPALICDDGSCLSEVIAICLYLDSCFPEPPLFGRDALERAQVVNWMHRIFTDGFLACAEALRNASPRLQNRALPGPDDIAQIPALAERGRQRLGLFLRDLERRLQGREFLVGELLSQADIDAYVVVDFAGWVKIGVPEDCVSLAAWRERVGALLA